MAADLKGVLKKTLVTALSLSLVITLMPLLASALTQDVTTAKGNDPRVTCWAACPPA